ncbi:MAG: hypothetical protein KC503_36530 [Myxococcales bacterium]|nr:hypothetical protein [Myxococcales bacterium]
MPAQRHPEIWYHNGYAGDVRHDDFEGRSASVGPTKMPHVFEALVQSQALPPGALHTDVRPIDLARLRRVHGDRYLHALLTGEPREIACGQGLPRWSPEIARGWLLNCGGLWQAACAAIASGGFTCNLAHGYHHAGLDVARDFCTINALVVVADALIREKRARKVLIVDLDEHEGNGTGELVIGKAPIFNLTIFGRAMDGPPAAGNHLPVFVDHAARASGRPRDLGYLAEIARWLPAVIRRHDPDLILYQAGVDPFDCSGISPEALAVRDAYVFALARTLERPLCWVLAGGYSPLEILVPQHITTIEQAIRVRAQMSDETELVLERREHRDDIYFWRVAGGAARFADWPTLAGSAPPRRPPQLSPAAARAYESRRVQALAAQRLPDDVLEAAYRALFAEACVGAGEAV